MAKRQGQPRTEGQTEAEQVAAAPVVETPQPATATPATDLETQVQELFAAQFGGEDNEPTEGTERWDNMVREMAVEADKLETEYRTILKKKEDNRTLLRAFAGMDKLPQIVCDYYYPQRTRRTKEEIAAEKAAAASNGTEGNASESAS